nr:MAG TPA: hypothetical protein [Caudoviricetes sp.]
MTPRFTESPLGNGHIRVFQSAVVKKRKITKKRKIGLIL